MKPGTQELKEVNATNGLSDTAKGLLARAGVELPNEPAAGSVEGQPDSPKEMLVDVGGAKRTVKVDELVAAFTEREKSVQATKAAEARLAELGDLNSIRALKQTIDSLDGRRRQKVLALLAGDEDEEDLDQGIRSAASGESDDGAIRDGLRPAEGISKAQFDELYRAVQVLAQREGGRMVSEKKQTLAEKIQAEMSQYPVFSGNEHAAAFARDSIITQLTHQEGDVSASVREAAARLQGMLDRRREELMEEVGVPRSMVQPADKRQLSAKGLKSGAVRRLAEEAIRNFGRR